MKGSFTTRKGALYCIVMTCLCSLLATGCASKYGAQTTDVHYYPDCYQPIERDVGLTRRTIEVLAAARHPFSIVTKGSGIERDLDLLVPLAQQHLVAVYVTLTTLQPELARKLEPRAAAPHRRRRGPQGRRGFSGLRRFTPHHRPGLGDRRRRKSYLITKDCTWISPTPPRWSTCRSA